MKQRRHPAAALALLLAVCPGATAAAGELRVAVASNFQPVLTVLAQDYAAKTGVSLVVSSGSSGQLAAQLSAGAPWDVFLSADRAKAAAVAQSEVGVPETLIRYARGVLVLVANHPSTAATCLDDRAVATWKIAIANPLVAPYGAAAQQTLETLELWPALQARLIRGENIAQTAQFVGSGAADAAFVAASQLIGAAGAGYPCRWRVPEALHAPIDQWAVAVRGPRLPAARRFLAYLTAPAAGRTIAAFGYLGD